jgi:hypothetical protein
MKERKPFLLRLDPALYEALEQWSQQELRSVNGQIEFLLRQAVNRHQRGTTKPNEADSRPSDVGPPPSENQ